MFSFERWKDGFLLTVEGLRIFRHSGTSPCFHLARPSEARSPASSKPVWKAMGPCLVQNEDSGSVTLDFPSMGSLRISYVSRILRLRFAPAGTPPLGFRIISGAEPSEMLFGAGPDGGYDLKNKRVSISPQNQRIPVVSSDSGKWCAVSGAESFDWIFRLKTMGIKADSMPEEVALGFGRTPAEGLGLLSAYLGMRSTQRHDAAMDAAGFPSAREFVRSLLSLSFSGRGVIHWPLPLAGPEAAGLRLLETAVFSPALMIAPRDIPDQLVSGGETLLDRSIRSASRIFGELEPYRSRCADEWSLEGLPMLRHPAVMYPDEKILWKSDDQYLFGEDILVAPVLASESRTRRVQLPEDSWVHLWTSRHYSGGTVVVDAPVGKPAVFYRSESPFAQLFDGIRKTATRM